TTQLTAYTKFRTLPRSSTTTPATPTASSIATRKAATVTRFVERGLAHFAELAIEPKRLLSDNAWCYRHNRSLRELLEAHGIDHRFIRPRRPQTNGKVERYQQTLKREWVSAASTAPASTAPAPCHTGSATTTSADP